MKLINFFFKTRQWLAAEATTTAQLKRLALMVNVPILVVVERELFAKFVITIQSASVHREKLAIL